MGLGAGSDASLSLSFPAVDAPSLHFALYSPTHPYPPTRCPISSRTSLPSLIKTHRSACCHGGSIRLGVRLDCILLLTASTAFLSLLPSPARHNLAILRLSLLHDRLQSAEVPPISCASIFVSLPEHRVRGGLLATGVTCCQTAAGGGGEG